MKKIYSVAVINKNFEIVANAKFSSNSAQKSLATAMEYVEYLVNCGFHAVVSCNGEIVNEYACLA
jgi:hypothetical protein